MYNSVMDKMSASSFQEHLSELKGKKKIKKRNFCWLCKKRTGAVQDGTFPLPSLPLTCVCSQGRVNTSSTLPRKMKPWRKISRQHEKHWPGHLVLADSYQNQFWISQYICSQSKVFLFLPIPNTVVPKKYKSGKRLGKLLRSMEGKEYLCIQTNMEPFETNMKSCVINSLDL